MLSPAIQASDKIRTLDNRWVYICDGKSQVDTKCYYDPETISYISNNQVSVWMKTVSPKKEQLLHLEISCASNMFHVLEDSTGMWGRKLKTAYVAGKWVKTSPDSEVYLLSKLVCKKPYKAAK